MKNEDFETIMDGIKVAASIYTHHGILEVQEAEDAVCMEGGESFYTMDQGEAKLFCQGLEIVIDAVREIE